MYGCDLKKLSIEICMKKFTINIVLFCILSLKLKHNVEENILFSEI